MFNKIFNIKSLICFFIVLALGIGTFFAIKSDVGAQVWAVFHKGNVLIKDGRLGVVGCGVETMKIGLGNAATEMRIDSPGSPLVCVGLAGIQETGAVEGYVTVGDAADFLRFSVQLPDTWIDLGVATNLEFEFDILETGAAQCDIDVRVFDDNSTTSTTPIFTDTIAIANAAARGWVNLVTLSTGIGADADLDQSDVLVFEITANTNADDFRIYGIRMKFAPGVERAIAESAR